ncbi:TPA: hypothetical protein P0E24_001676 [Vibrio campbellii]|nr:hypothetical protein [Vibrio campbellii]HDM8242615.1 hypothetical protein [Vibrio campbellii]
MGEFLQMSAYIFDDLHDQEILDNSVAELLAAGEHSEEELEAETAD